MSKGAKIALVIGAVLAVFIVLYVVIDNDKEVPLPYDEVVEEDEFIDDEEVIEEEQVVLGVIEYDGSVDLTRTPERKRVIDFYATWCGPCRMMKPIFHEVAEQYGAEMDFYSVDTDQFEELSAYYQIQYLPTIIVLNPDGTKKSSVGYVDKDELEAFINS